MGIVIIHVPSYSHAFPHSLARACVCLPPALAHPTRCGGPSARLIVEGLGPTNCGSGVALAHNAALPPRILHRPTCHTVLLYTEDVDTGKLSTDVHTRAPPFPGPPPSMDTRCVRSISRSVITAASSEIAGIPQLAGWKDSTGSKAQSL